MQITITIPKLATMLREWKWGLLAALVLALMLTSGGSSPVGAPSAEALGDAEMSLNAANYDAGDTGLQFCDQPSKPTKCAATVGEQFDIIVEVNAASSGYNSLAAEIDPGGLIFKPGPTCNKEVIWPDYVPGFCLTFNVSGHVSHSATSSTKSTFLGPVVKFNVACPATQGSHKVTLVPDAAATTFGTHLSNAAVTQLPKELVPGLEVDSLTINCLAEKREININPVQIAPGPPFGCYSVRDAVQAELFQVCDNDAQAGFPQTQPFAGLCDEDLTVVCEDSDPAKGKIRVSIATGNYNVVESKQPPLYGPTNSGKQSCDVKTQAKCELIFQNTAQTVAWFPEDVNGDGQVALGDFLRLLAAFSQVKP